MVANRIGAVVVLAAGASTRFRSSTPKVLHSLCGRKMIEHALHAARQLNPEKLIVVVRHERDAVAERVLRFAPEAIIADQDDIKGTGRAVWCALEKYDGDGPVLVMAGDTPLITGEILTDFWESYQAAGDCVATVLSTHVPNPFGYGRIVRNDEGDVEAIVEERDATEEQRALTEISSATFIFDATFLRHAIGTISADNAQGEWYLGDVLLTARAEGKRITAHVLDDYEAVEGANTLVQLAQLRSRIRDRYLEKLMLSGVQIIDPATTWIDVTVEIEPDAVIYQCTEIRGVARVGARAKVGPYAMICDTVIGPGAQVPMTWARKATIGEGEHVPPFSDLSESNS